MKKTILCFLLITCCLLSGCQKGFDLSNSETINNIPPAGASVIEKYAGDFETVIYGETENSSIFHTNNNHSAGFNSVEFIDPIATQSIDVDIFGTVYKGNYITTAKIACSDITVHHYNLEGTESGHLFIDASTGKIVKYGAVPYNQNEFESESDYKNFIQKILNPDSNLSKYNYECVSQYYYQDPDNGGGGSKTVNGFKNDCTEYERIGRYYFFYTQSVNGVHLEDHISANFSDRVFNIEIYEPNYDIEQFQPLLIRMEEAEKAVKYHLQKNVKEGVTVVSIEHGKKEVFIQDGIPYLKMTSTVEYMSKYYSESYSITVTTITG